ncbi:MAG: sigma-70 family RNA polymerase sigma factor [Planctomycetes bacterium]|nr:sigma-70 family RNA polymerase sigma factor [Planctomycetota bacterium]
MSPSDHFRTASAEFLAHRHDLQAFVLGMTRDHALAEDILQDAWVQLAQAIADGTIIDNVPGWCRTVAKHAILRHWKRAGRERAADAEVMDLLEQGFRERAPDDGSWTAHIEALRTCVSTMQSAVRRLVESRYLDGQRAEDIAAAEGSTYEAVMMRLSRARQALRHCVEKRLAGEAT